MNRLFLVFGLAVSVVLLTGSTALAQQQSQDEIRRLLVEQYEKADEAGNVDAKMRLYMPDAVLMPPDGTAIVGYQAVRTWHQETYARTSSQLSSKVDEVQMLGDWAFARGSWSGAITPKAGGAAKQEAGRFVILLRRLPDGGSWRIAREMWNAQPASSTGDLK
jgi:uncharacterized protein (TIGR02246 family)